MTREGFHKQNPNCYINYLFTLPNKVKLINIIATHQVVK